jgi:hypothetical protein
VCGKHLSLDTPITNFCVRYLSLIGPNGVCRLCESLFSRILDVKRGVCQKYFPQKSQCQASSMWHTCLLKLLVLLIEYVLYCSQVTPNVGILRFMSVGNLIVERRFLCISHCARNGLLILALFLPYVWSRIVASDCSQLRSFSWFP